MKFTRAEITAKSEAKKREQNLVRFQDWLVNDPDAKSLAKAYIAKLNKRYNCINFKNT